MVATSIYRLTQLGKLHLSRLICSVWIESAGPIYRSLIKMVIFTFENHVQTLVHVVSFSFLLSWLGNGDSYNLICSVQEGSISFYKRILCFVASFHAPPLLLLLLLLIITLALYTIFASFLLSPAPWFINDERE